MSNSYQKVMALIDSDDLTDQQVAAIITTYAWKLCRSTDKNSLWRLSSCVEYISKHVTTKLLPDDMR